MPEELWVKGITVGRLDPNGDKAAACTLLGNAWFRSTVSAFGHFRPSVPRTPIALKRTLKYRLLAFPATEESREFRPMRTSELNGCG